LNVRYGAVDAAVRLNQRGIDGHTARRRVLVVFHNLVLA
jgi:hypothetical protein